MSANDNGFKEIEECELCGNPISKEWVSGGWQYEAETAEVLDVLCCGDCVNRLKPFIDAYDSAEEELRREMGRA